MASDSVTTENEQESDLPSVSSCPELSSSTRGLSPSLSVQVRAVEEATNVGQGEKVKGTRQVDFIDISGDDVMFGRSSPTPRYSVLSEKLRRLGSGHNRTQQLQCSAFCGGQSCKYETPLKWLGDDMAFKGLFSHWYVILYSRKKWR